jgi:hypothetical protein
MQGVVEPCDSLGFKGGEASPEPDDRLEPVQPAVIAQLRGVLEHNCLIEQGSAVGVVLHVVPRQAFQLWTRAQLRHRAQRPVRRLIGASAHKSILCSNTLRSKSVTLRWFKARHEALGAG